MNRKYISLVLALMLVLSLFTGCEAVGQIAGSVADAAIAELETQIRAILEEYKMDVIELKTTAGKLNDGEGDIQFFCAVLVSPPPLASRIWASSMTGVSRGAKP